MSPTEILLIALGALLVVSLLILLLLSRRRPSSMEGEIERIGASLDRLQELFLVPRSRGPLGERLLEQALGDLLPPTAYKLQQSFRDGSRVDALLLLGELSIPMDAKFPLESVSPLLQGEGDPKKAFRAVEKHMESIATKYIRPAEGTTPFALMYIPSERVYYELFVRNGEIRGDRRVLPLSPGSLALYLQTLSYGLGLIRVDRSVREQLRLVEASRGSAASLRQRFDILQKHLSNAASAANQTAVQLERLEQDLAALDGSLGEQQR